MCSTINMPIVYTVYYLTVILTLFLTNPPLFNTPPLPVLTRHGQSEYNAIGRIGGDSGLSGHGVAYAKALGDFVAKKVSSNEDGSREDIDIYLCSLSSLCVWIESYVLYTLLILRILCMLYTPQHTIHTQYKCYTITPFNTIYTYTHIHAIYAYRSSWTSQVRRCQPGCGPPPCAAPRRPDSSYRRPSSYSSKLGAGSGC